MYRTTLAKLFIFATLTVVLAGCESATKVEPVSVSRLCVRMKRAKPFFVAHVDQRGEAYQDDAPKGEYDGVVRRVATALAVPRRSTYVRKYRADCHEKTKDVWYPCIKEQRIDFSRIKGLARAPKMARARAVARQICEAEVWRKSPRFGGHARRDARRYQCTVTQQVFCPIFKASKALKARKKRLREQRRQDYERRHPERPDCPSGSTYCMPAPRR